MVRGDAANELISFVADPNVLIQESKALTGNIEPGRRSQRRRVVTSGPIVEDVPSEVDLRDSPPARNRPHAAHGLAASLSKESEQG